MSKLAFAQRKLFKRRKLFEHWQKYGIEAMMLHSVLHYSEKKKIPS